VAELPYVLVKTKGAGLIVLENPSQAALARVEVISRHGTWYAANAARERLK